MTPLKKCTHSVRKFFKAFEAITYIAQTEASIAEGNLITSIENDSKDSINIHDEVLQEFECPVCISYAAPPIMMCLRSHVICIACWRRCPTCPTCRITRSNTRAFFLEEIHSLLNFPCKYDECSFMATGIDTFIHQKCCNYKPVRCPLEENFNCHWHGPWKRLKFHLLEKHAKNVYFGRSAQLVNHKFTETFQNTFVFVLYCAGHLFQVTWQYNKAQLAAKFTIKQMGFDESVWNFNFYLTFFKKEVPDSTDIVITGSVPPEETGRAVESYVLISELMTMASLNHGDLYYKIQFKSPPLNKPRRRY